MGIGLLVAAAIGLSVWRASLPTTLSATDTAMSATTGTTAAAVSSETLAPEVTEETPEEQKPQDAAAVLTDDPYLAPNAYIPEAATRATPTQTFSPANPFESSETATPSAEPFLTLTEEPTSPTSEVPVSPSEVLPTEVLPSEVPPSTPVESPEPSSSPAATPSAEPSVAPELPSVTPEAPAAETPAAVQTPEAVETPEFEAPPAETPTQEAAAPGSNFLWSSWRLFPWLS